MHNTKLLNQQTNETADATTDPHEFEEEADFNEFVLDCEEDDEVEFAGF